MLAFGAVHGLDLAKAAVAGEGAEDAQAQFVEQRRDVPELAADVPFADQIDVVTSTSRALSGGRDGSGSRVPITCAIGGVAGDAVAEVLVAVEAGAIDRHDRDAELLARRLGHRLDVVALQRRHAGVVDEHRRRLVASRWPGGSP